MKRIFILTLSILAFNLNTFISAQKIGSWQTYFSYEGNLSEICDGGEIVYALTSDGKLFSYSPSDQNLEEYLKMDGGNTNIKNIAYNKKSKKLLIIREDSDIDLLDDRGYLSNLPFLKDNTDNIDKTIYGITMYEEFAYISTGFGILTINMAKNEIKETCRFNFKVYSNAISDNIIYISSEEGIKYIDLSKNIQELALWTALSISTKNPFPDFTFTDTEIRNLAFLKNQLHLLVPNKALYILNGDNLDRVLEGKYPQNLKSISNDRLLAKTIHTFWDFDNIKSYSSTNTLTQTDTIHAVEPQGNSNSQYWWSINEKNLSLIKTSASEKYEEVTPNIKPLGPLSNTPFYMRHDGDKLMYVGGGYHLDRYGYSGALSEYKEDKWFNYDKKEIESQLGLATGSVRDFVNVISSPSDKNRIFVESWGEGLYEFKDRKFVALHGLNRFESVIGSSPNYIRLNGMDYDKNGNLWIANTNTEDLVTILTKNGEWSKLSYSSLGIPSVSARNLISDRYNNKWIASYRGTSAFLLIIDGNNTSKTLYQKVFYDQDSKVVSLTRFNNIAEDHNGNIWIGTDAGIYVIYNSSNIISKGSVTTSKIKIPRNDGTNNADILLENVNINFITVDGANRKWIGTDGSGVFLVSENGQETIHIFTTKNSPMPSDNVLSVAVDPNTGIVFIGTDKGIVSYKSDATEGKADFSDVYVYPNPVRPEFDGVITVYGLQANSNVKITDIRGNLINQGKSLGGQYTWNGRNGNGTKVDTGTYLVMGASEDGKTGVVTKILVVR